MLFLIAINPYTPVHTIIQYYVVLLYVCTCVYIVAQYLKTSPISSLIISHTQASTLSHAFRPRKEFLAIYTAQDYSKLHVHVHVDVHVHVHVCCNIPTCT